MRVFAALCCRGTAVDDNACRDGVTCCVQLLTSEMKSQASSMAVLYVMLCYVTVEYLMVSFHWYLLFNADLCFLVLHLGQQRTRIPPAGSATRHRAPARQYAA